ncbi:hypothetical protein K8I85_04715, partial [bacterium]|nr:hypothetical protein [bacterium]
LYRYLLPQRPPVRAWASASFLAPGASLLACAGASLRRRRLVWRDLSYDLERDGCVAVVTPVVPDPEPDDGLATEAA